MNFWKKFPKSTRVDIPDKGTVHNNRLTHNLYLVYRTPLKVTGLDSVKRNNET